MRPLNAASYIMIEVLRALRRTAYRDIGVWTIGYGPHRRGREGETLTADQAYKERALQAADTSASFTPIHRNLEKLTIFKLCGV
jgi:GH24 family phage-related lysozyme (muramidase)